MVGVTERLRRENAHVVATMAWNNIHRRSCHIPRARTAGRAEMSGGYLTNQPFLNSLARQRKRELAQKRHEEQLRTQHEFAVATARPWDPRALDRSRYFPHASVREMARRARRIGAPIELREAA